MKTSRVSVLVILGITGLVANAVYWGVLHKGVSGGNLHPASLHVTNRPQLISIDVVQVFPEKAPSQVAILLTKSDENGESAIRCLQTMGIPFLVTRDLRIALGHKLLVLYPEVDGRTYDAGQAQAISDFVARGGIIFAQNVLWGGFKTLFGFDDVVPLRTRHKIVFDTTNPEATDATLRYLNRPAEKEVPLGSSAIPEVIWSNGYKPAAGTRSLARFEDGSIAVLRHDVGRGHTYLIGVALEDLRQWLRARNRCLAAAAARLV